MINTRFTRLVAVVVTMVKPLIHYYTASCITFYTPKFNDLKKCTIVSSQSLINSLVLTATIIITPSHSTILCPVCKITAFFMTQQRFSPAFPSHVPTHYNHITSCYYDVIELKFMVCRLRKNLSLKKFRYYNATQYLKVRWHA